VPLFAPFAYAKLHKRQSDALRKDHLVPGSGQGQGRQVPAFATMHAAVRPPGAVPTDPSTVRCSEPVRASTEDDEEDEDAAAAAAAAAAARARPVPTLTTAGEAVVDDLLSFDPPTPNATAAPFKPSVPKDASFQLVNKDTGEVLDLLSFYGDQAGNTNPLAARR
jgi:hypothetical protein